MEGSGERENPNRSARNRATRASVREASRERASRSKNTKVATKREVSSANQTNPKPSSEDSRKAPTTLSATKAKRVRQKKQVATLVSLLIIGVASSALIGTTDKGQINVQQTIEERNNRIRSNQANEDDISVTNIEIPVQNTNTSNKPDGGLRGLGITEKPPAPKPDTSSSTATSSDESASSSPEVSGDENEEEEVVNEEIVDEN